MQGDNKDGDASIAPATIDKQSLAWHIRRVFAQYEYRVIYNN
jgi:hypothetical protein